MNLKGITKADLFTRYESSRKQAVELEVKLTDAMEEIDRLRDKVNVSIGRYRRARRQLASSISAISQLLSILNEVPEGSYSAEETSLFAVGRLCNRDKQQKL